MIRNPNIHSIQKILISLFILLLCCLIAWWPLTFHIFSLKNDALNYHLAIRYQISESIYNGYLPFWSPYLNLGYPLHGDMQSGVWNPIVQIICLFGPYTLKTLQYEFLFYIYLSGTGMFFLLKYFFNDIRICLLAAAAYMLCGYITDSGQFLNWISAASFLPFVFLFYFRTITERNWKAALTCGVFYFLFFTTAYPADFILISYLLLILFLWHLYLTQNRTKKILLQQIKLNVLIGIIFLLLSLPAIISYVEFLPLSERGSGASYEQAMSNYLHPALLFSFLTPLPVWKASFAAGITDPLTRNCFLGLITFTLLLTAFFIKLNQRLQRFLKWAFILSLIFSFGPIGGLRFISYYMLPLMNTFRHPANARLFSIFFGCLLAAFSLQQLRTGFIKNTIRKYIWIILLACFAGLLIWSFTGSISIFTNHSFQKNPRGFKLFLDSLSFSDFLLFNIILQIPFLIALYCWFVKKFKLKWLLIASLVNSTLHTALYLPFSAIKKDSVTAIQNILNLTKQKGYPIPDLSTSIAQNSKDGNKCFDAIGSCNMYNKKIGRIDYKVTPSNLITQNEFWLNKKIKDILFEYPLFYKADTIIGIADSSKVIFSQKRIVLLSNKQIKKIVTADSTSIYRSTIQKFTPNEWEIEIQNNKPAFFSVFQNYYPRWQLFVDGRKQFIERCNISFMGFELPAGKHFVSFRYKAWDLQIAYLISCITLIFILLLLLIKRNK